MSDPQDMTAAHQQPASAATPADTGQGMPGQVRVPMHAPPAAGVAQQLDLRDIHMPGAPSLWPLAPGWWLFAVLALVVAVAGVTRLLRLWRARRRRDRIVAELDRLRGERCGPQLVGAVSALLKRAALSRFPRTEVASLTGRDWLAFLDRTGGAGAFAGEVGRVLADGPYAPRHECDTAALIALAQRWLRQNL